MADKPAAASEKIYKNAEFRMSKTDLPSGRCRVELTLKIDEDDPEKGCDGLTCWRSVSPATYAACLGMWVEAAKRIASLGFTRSSDGMVLSATSVPETRLSNAEHILINVTLALNEFGIADAKRKGRIDPNYVHKDQGPKAPGHSHK
jgi:hypothetical protein